MRSDEKAHVLVVEDDPDIMRGLVIRLKAAGYTVSSAPDAVVAMTTAVRQQPDLILMDIGLPGGDGHMVMERLGRNALTAAIPVIFLSARADRENMQRALENGAAGYLTKPFRSDELLALVAQTLGVSDPEESEDA